MDVMTEVDLIKHPVTRRWYLLAKALEVHPLDKALSLAQSALDFIESKIDGEQNGHPVDNAIHHSNGSTINGHSPAKVIAIDEILDFLRGQGEDVKSIDGKFKIGDIDYTLPELVGRANTLRGAQQEPHFEMFRSRVEDVS